MKVIRHQGIGVDVKLIAPDRERKGREKLFEIGILAEGCASVVATMRHMKGQALNDDASAARHAAGLRKT